MLNKLILVFICFSLTACASLKDKEIIEVQIPIRMPCSVETPGEPQWAINDIKRQDDIYTKIKALLSDRELSMAYQKELKTALEACQK